MAYLSMSHAFQSPEMSWKSICADDKNISQGLVRRDDGPQGVGGSRLLTVSLWLGPSVLENSPSCNLELFVFFARLS